MAINGIGSDFSSNFQRSFGTTTNEATSSSNLGATPSSEFDAAQTSEASSQGASDQAVSGASDSSGISQEAQEASGSQAVQGSLSGRAEQLTAKLKESLEAITSDQESGGDTSTAVASLKETYQSGESNGGLDGVETDVKDQTEQILGIKSGGSTSSASAADGTATVGEAEATSDSATSGQQGGETYSAGIKSGLDALLGSA